MCVATSVEELESLGAELALSAKHADQELSSLVGALAKLKQSSASGLVLAHSSAGHCGQHTTGKSIVSVVVCRQLWSMQPNMPDISVATVISMGGCETDLASAFHPLQFLSTAGMRCRYWTRWCRRRRRRRRQRRGEWRGGSASSGTWPPPPCTLRATAGVPCSLAYERLAPGCLQIH